MSTVYKVVVNRWGHYLSSNTTAMKADPPLVLEYAIDKKTEPIFGKLFAFSSLRAAKKYAGYRSASLFTFPPNVILKCAATGVTRPSFSKCMGEYNEKQARKFWLGKSVGDHLKYHVDSGTVLCSSIIPLEVME